MEGGTWKKRQSVNFISLFVTCLFLFLAVQFSDGGVTFATKIKKITENLERAVLTLNDNVTYTDYEDKSTYNSSTVFKAVGMTGLYNLTNMFIDQICPKDILMDGIFWINSNNEIEIENPELSKLFKYYAALVSIVLFLALCLVLFPVCGLCFCCCRCCGNCGAKPQPSDKKKDTCKKVVEATLLIVCGTGLLFCIVCAFGSNQQLNDGINEFPKNMNLSIKDTKTFMDATDKEIRNLFKTNYDEFSDAFTNIMENGSVIAMEQLKEYVNATTVSKIYEFAEQLPEMEETLTLLKSSTNRLRVYASQLNDAIRKVKKDLYETLNSCGSQIDGCSEVHDKVQKLQTSIDFNAVPDVSDAIKTFKSIDINQIREDAKKGNQSLFNIQQKINETLTKGLATAKQQINNTATTINEQLETLTDTLKQVKAQIDNNALPPINTAQNYIHQYGKYQYYIGLTISCILLLVTVCIVFGLICGICGKRPDGYSDNCCNKGAGGQFLLCAVTIMFLFGFLLSIITLVSFIVGVISEKAICDTLRNPNSSQSNIMSLIDSLKLDMAVDITPSTMLNNCYQNKSIYETFNLASQFNLDTISERFNISAELDKLNIDESIIDNVDLIGNNSFEKLLNIDIDIDVSRFRDELQTNLTNYSLDEITKGLTSILYNIGDNEKFQTLKSNLELSLLHITTYNDKLVIPMKYLANNIMDTADSLNEQLKMNHSSFHEAVSDLINDLQEAQNALKTHGPEGLKNTANYFKSVIQNIINGYLDRIRDQAYYKIGKCGPLNLVIHATITSTCEKVLLPLNGFWFSLFCTIILYVITIIIAVKLANLYRKHKPGYDHYVETEYLYDAYADRGDNIPLNSRGGKRGKKKGKKSKRYDERSNTGRAVAREYAPGTHPPDGRYADMAPKHWEEFPNGGPPHYQRAPTEYERPPPYYYPGSGGEQ